MEHLYEPGFWRPITILQYESREVHYIVVLTGGRMIIAMRDGFSIVDTHAVYYPLPDPPAALQVYIEPDQITDACTDSKGTCDKGTDSKGEKQNG